MKTYLFDFDGTLVDSMPVYISAALRILSENGIPFDEGTANYITPLGSAGIAEYYISLGIKMQKEEIIALMNGYMLDGYFNSIPEKQNVTDTLKYLKQKQISLNILTASPHVTLDACLKRLNIFDLFDNVWSCDDLQMTKSAPQIYVEVAKKLGVDPQDIVFFDDNMTALKSAQEANLTVCGVFDKYSENSTEEIKSFADFYIRSFDKNSKVFNL